MAGKQTPAALEANCLQSREWNPNAVCDALHLLVNDEQELELTRLHGLVEQRLPKTPIQCLPLKNPHPRHQQHIEKKPPTHQHH